MFIFPIIGDVNFEPFGEGPICSIFSAIELPFPFIFKKFFVGVL